MLFTFEMQAIRRVCSSVARLRFSAVIPRATHFSNLIGQDYVVKGSTPDIEAPNRDIYSFISKRFSKFGPKIAIVNGNTGRQYSYNELDESICKFSSSLQNNGFNSGDVMCVVSPNSPEYPVVFLSVLRCGGVVSTCNPAFTASELAFQFQNSNAKIVATIPQCLPAVQEAAARAKVRKIVVIDTGDPQSSSTSLMSYQSMLREPGSILNSVASNPYDVAVLPYSSGTTGFPKGVMLTNYSIASNVLQLIHDEILDLESNPSNCLIGILPFFHIYGMVVVLLSSLYAGTKVVSLPQFEPESFLSTVDRYNVNIAHLVPPLVLFLAKHPLVDKYDLSSLQEILTGAAPLGGEMVTAAVSRIKCRLIRQGYGLTETSPVTHMMPRSLGTKYPGSIGECIRSTRTKIVDPDSGESLPANTEGEVWISGPQLMKGYLNNADATQGCLTADGWFKSGDIGEYTYTALDCRSIIVAVIVSATVLGYYDDQGLFYITDRLKELIKVKGLQVAPAELEAVLLTHPKIADAAVIGVPNERMGEAPRAFVVRKDEGLTEKEVNEFVAEKVKGL